MTTVAASSRIALKNILYLTDFSEPSETALPFAAAIAREYASKIYVQHIILPTTFVFTTLELVPSTIDAQEDTALEEVRHVESQLAGIPYETIVERGVGVWPEVARTIEDCGIDLIVLGTRGRTGAQKFLLGSVAEEIFRRSSVPVLTIGPHVRTGNHNGARFHRILFATDFKDESLAAAPYAISLAQENQARLVLLHVMRECGQCKDEKLRELSVAEAMYQLHETVPKSAELWCRAEPVVRFGNPGDLILEVARERDADLIVLGVRDAAGRLSAATHLERTTAHKVVAYAECPVVTVRH